MFFHLLIQRLFTKLIYQAIISITNDAAGLNYNPEQYNITVTLDLRDNINPDWFNPSQDTDMPAGGDIVNVSSYWTDNINLSWAILSVNKTGSWSNISESINNLTFSSNESWANFSINTSGLTFL